MTLINGSSDSFLSGHTKLQPATVSPIPGGRAGLNVIAFSSTILIATESVVLGTATSLVSSGSAAKKGDQLKFTSGSFLNLTFDIIDVAGTTYTLGQRLASSPAFGDTFQILRYHPLILNSSGSITASGDPSANTVLKYTEVTGVGVSTLTTIATYTAIATTRVNRILCSGTDYAKFRLVKNSVIIGTLRSGPGRNIEFLVDISLTTGDILDAKVIHFNTGFTSDFEALILGF